MLLHPAVIASVNLFENLLTAVFGIIMLQGNPCVFHQRDLSQQVPGKFILIFIFQAHVLNHLFHKLKSLFFPDDVAPMESISMLQDLKKHGMKRAEGNRNLLLAHQAVKTLFHL